MDDILISYIKEKIFSYLKGEISINDLYDWACQRKEFEEAIVHIKDKSDIIFFLLNQSGLETSNFYIEEKLIITKANIVKNIDRFSKAEISNEDFYNWADDVYNWDLVEDYEDELARITVEQLSEDAKRISELKKEDIDNIKWHLETSKDAKLSTARIIFIFFLPFYREIVSGKLSLSDKLQKITETGKYFPDDGFFYEFADVLKIYITSGFGADRMEQLFLKLSRGSSPGELLKRRT